MCLEQDLKDEIDRVKTRIVLDVTPWAYELQSNIAEGIVKEPLPGFYFPYSTFRIQELSKELFYKEGGKLKPLDSYVKAITNRYGLYNWDGTPVIPESETGAFYQRVSHEPLIPANYCNLIISAIIEYFKSNTKSNIFMSDYKITNYLSEPYTYVLGPSDILSEGLLRCLGDFIGTDYLHMFSIKVVDTSVFITKEIDFRIYEWFMDRIQS